MGWEVLRDTGDTTHSGGTTRVLLQAVALERSFQKFVKLILPLISQMTSCTCKIMPPKSGMLWIRGGRYSHFLTMQCFVNEMFSNS